MTDWKDEAFWLGWNNHDTAHGDCEWEACDVAFCKDFKPKERKAWREKRGLRMLTTPRKRAFWSRPPLPANASFVGSGGEQT